MRFHELAEHLAMYSLLHLVLLFALLGGSGTKASRRVSNVQISQVSLESSGQALENDTSVFARPMRTSNADWLVKREDSRTVIQGKHVFYHVGGHGEEISFYDLMGEELGMAVVSWSTGFLVLKGFGARHDPERVPAILHLPNTASLMGPHSSIDVRAQVEKFVRKRGIGIYWLEEKRLIESTYAIKLWLDGLGRATETDLEKATWLLKDSDPGRKFKAKPVFYRVGQHKKEMPYYNLMGEEMGAADVYPDTRFLVLEGLGARDHEGLVPAVLRLTKTESLIDSKYVGGVRTHLEKLVRDHGKYIYWLRKDMLREEQ